jgi:thiol-disulfide isomerase/thioredoxin
MRSRPRAAALAATVLALVLAGCAGDGGTTPTGTSSGGSGGGGGGGVAVDVDTPELRTLKQQAGVEGCEGLAGGEPGSAGDDGLPAVTLPCLGGGPDVDLSTLRGPLVVNLWAQWCGPCRAELPYYQRLHEQGDGQVDVVGVDYQDTQPAAALELVAETGVTYPLLADPAARLRVPFRVRGLPAIVLVDERGVVVHSEFVAIRSYDQLADLVREHLDVRL